VEIYTRRTSVDIHSLRLLYFELMNVDSSAIGKSIHVQASIRDVHSLYSGGIRCSELHFAPRVTMNCATPERATAASPYRARWTMRPKCFCNAYPVFNTGNVSSSQMRLVYVFGAIDLPISCPAVIPARHAQLLQRESIRRM
jgi:hypothetical protein